MQLEDYWLDMDIEGEPAPVDWLELLVAMELGCTPDVVRRLWVNDVMDVLDRMAIQSRMQTKRVKEMEMAKAASK